MNKNNLLSCLIGQIIEWYDFTIYGFLATIMALNFFPNQSLQLSLISSFAVFAVGFIARPIGSLLFGYYGDKAGRKAAFKYSILLMTLPTLLIGLLPTYQTLSIWAPILLAILRIAQGLACGGEFIGSIIFLGEHSPQEQQPFWCSFAWFGSLLGTLLGLITCILLSTFFSTQKMNDWGWRIAFLGSSVGLIAIFWFRRHAEETPQFLSSKTKEKQSDLNLISTLKKYKNKMIAISISSIQIAIMSYLIIIYLPTYLHVFLGYSTNFSRLLGVINIVALIILLPIAGKFLTNIYKQYLAIWIPIINFSLAYPIFQLLIHHNFWAVFLGDALLILLCCITITYFFPLFLHIAPVKARFKIVAISYNLTIAIFGGTTPMVIIFFSHFFQSNIFPAYYLMLSAAISIIGCIALTNFLNINTDPS